MTSASEKGLPAVNGPKLGERIAQQIEHEIVARRIAIGTQIGTERDLALRFGVSRWAMREAIAICEMDGLVESRRGRAGGLYVTAPADDTRMTTLRHYFILVGASGEEILEIRRVLEGLALTLAMRRLGTREAERLRALALKPEGAAPERLARNTHAMLVEVLRLADNPALSLFCLSLAQASIDRAFWHGASTEAIQHLSEETWRHRLDQIEAIIAGRLGPILAAQRCIARSGAAIHATFLEPPGDVASAIDRASIIALGYTFARGARRVKKPEGIARLIAQRLNGPWGDQVHSESSLIETFRVSRNVLRESVRLLENFGVARMRPGQDGGLERVRSNPANVVRATALYLAEVDAWSPEGFGRILRELQSLCVDAFVRRLQRAPLEAADAVKRFRSWLDEHEGWSASVEYDALMHARFLARAGGNGVLECIMRIVVFQVGFQERALRERDRPVQRGLQRRLTDALCSGDAPLAKRIVIELDAMAMRYGPHARASAELVTARDDHESDGPAPMSPARTVLD